MGGKIWSKTPWYSEKTTVPVVSVTINYTHHFLKSLVPEMNRASELTVFKCLIL